MTARHPHHVAERGHDRVRLRCQVDGVVHPPHGDDAHRAPGAVDERDGLGQVVLEPVLVDRVRVAAAHLHELVLAARLTQFRDPGRQGARLLGVAELIDEPHGTHPYSIRDSARAARAPPEACPIPPRTCSAAAASLSSILDRAKPTWMSTHSPASGGSSASRPMLITRRTPLTSTLARSAWSGRNSTTSPGMPRHI